MSAESTTCVLVKCDVCDRYDEHYEYETPVHWPSLDVAVKELTRDHDGIERQWSFDEETKALTCPQCLAVQRCEAAGGHDWTAWSERRERGFRYCQRESCDTSESRSVETGGPL